MSAYLSALNSVQQEAVKQTDGPVMVIAGAGSGKTRVLTFRIAYLMEQGVDPFNILALTFTNKAAREMKGRIEKLLGGTEAKNLWMGTFHSIFARILRIEGHRLGYPSNFTIYDTEDAQKVIAGLIKDRGLDKDIYKVKGVASRISAYKNNLITPKAYQNRADLQEADASARMPQLGELYGAYMEKCFRAGAMDFDDLLLKTNELFIKFPDALARYQERFKYILVDEYQDTNHSQYLIVKALASRFENLCVVGDDAQSIYAFRGANIRNILNFQKDYADAKLFKLEQNYRSTGCIVQAANSLIKHNQDQLEKDVWTSNPQGDRIVVHKSVSDADEGNYVAQTIWELNMREHMAHDQFAILYRTNAQSRAFEDALRRRNIPYRIYGGLSFYQRKEVKDLMAYVRLTVNPKDEEAFRRVINLPARGIGDTTLARLTIAADERQATIWEAAEHAGAWGVNINRPTQERLLAFTDLIKSYQIIAQEKDAFDVVEHISRSSGIIKFLAEDKTPEGISRYENVQELLNGIKDFVEQQQQVEDGDPSLGAFLQDVALLTDADRADEDDRPKVNLMTIHLAKGLEFPAVFVVGMEENLFPSMMSMGSRSDLEEERRLFYVALTRAEKRAFLTYAHVRYRWGKLIDCEPSRFLEELDEAHLDIHVPEFQPTYSVPKELMDAFDVPSTRRTAAPSRPASPKPTKPSPPPAPVRFRRPTALKPMNQATQSAGSSGSNALELGLEIGFKVVHDRFGIGKVTELTGDGTERKATILFDNAGEKKLLLKFAKLQLLS
ncbi:MAG: ATP-dependent DNA helicase [Flavobacteriia bacterium]|nr:ATP-dependent DNA helicase [Flavobacteriia bacterium]